MFTLCKTCADTLNKTPCTHSEQERSILNTWCQPELMKAIEKGYQILKIHEVWHFPVHTAELFKEYVNTFLKIKQESSGYPKDCVTEEQKQTYIGEYYEHEGIRLDSEKIDYNPGLRSLSKLMLNSLWGMLYKKHLSLSYNSTFSYAKLLARSSAKLLARSSYGRRGVVVSCSNMAR